VTEQNEAVIDKATADIIPISFIGILQDYSGTLLRMFVE
jgi:hypothetical protein